MDRARVPLSNWFTFCFILLGVLWRLATLPFSVSKRMESYQAFNGFERSKPKLECQSRIMMITSVAELSALFGLVDARAVPAEETPWG